MWRVLVLLSALAIGCVQTVSSTQYGAIPAAHTEEPERLRVAGRADLGASVEGAFERDEALGFVITAAQGATISAAVAGVHAEVLFYGPLTPDARWEDIPVLARGEGRIAMTAPENATYLIAVMAPEGTRGAFTLRAQCVSGDCGVECGPDGACPAGSLCAWIECIRAPCPSYCRAVVASDESASSATCGTRGAPECPPDRYCRHPIAAACGEADAPGTCERRPDVCTRDYRPVCGCDGRTYGNACSAAVEGISVRREGACESS